MVKGNVGDQSGAIEGEDGDSLEPLGQGLKLPRLTDQCRPSLVGSRDRVMARPGDLFRNVVAPALESGTFKR
jgi:hypothetical protein